MTEISVSHEQIKIAVCGNADAGKSTLIGTLINDILDDGNGLSRESILKCLHEKQTGRTSTISHNFIRYDDICKEINLIDLAGQECYMRTTAHGIIGNNLDYGIVVIGANMGINDTTREHLLMLIWLKIPFIIVVTKEDICPDHIRIETIKKIKNLSRFVEKQEAIMGNSFSGRVVTVLNNEKEKIKTFLENSGSPDYYMSNIPVIVTSSKTGKNIDILHSMFRNMVSRKPISTVMLPDIFTYIETVYIVPFVGMVLTSTLPHNSPPLHVGSTMYLGPVKFNVSDKKHEKFVPVKIKSLHDNNRTIITVVKPGESFCANIKFIKNTLERKHIHKGSILTSNPEEASKNVSKTFIADVRILSLKTTIINGYSPLIHFKTIRQPAKIIKIETDNEENKVVGYSNAKITFEFVNHVEFIEPGLQLFFRDRITKGTGKILSVVN